LEDTTHLPPEPAGTPVTATGVSAQLRLAVLSVDADGNISYWNRGAEELFGHRWDSVFGHPASGLLAPHGVERQDPLDLLDDLAQPAWAGALPATERDGAVRDVLWWSYRITETAGRSLLVIATNAKPLRAGALRLALGGRLLPFAAAELPSRDGVRVAARLAPVPDRTHGELLAARLGSVLPRLSAGRLERIMRQIVPLGYPVLEVEGEIPLPVLPQEYQTYEAEGVTGTRAAGLTNRKGEPRGRALTAGGSSPAVPDQRSAPDPGRDEAAGTGPDGPRDATAGTDPDGGHDTTAGTDPDGRHDEAAETDPDGGPAPGPIAAVPALTEVPPPVLGSLGSGPCMTDSISFASPAPGQTLDEQLALLREAGAKVGTTLDLGTTARELCAVAVPRFADFADIIVVDQLFSYAEPHKDDHSNGVITARRVAVAHNGPPHLWDSAVPEGELLQLPSEEIAPRLGEPLLIPVIDPALAADIATDLGIPALAPLLPGRSLIVAPLTARGTALGRICLLRDPGRRPFDVRDATTTSEIAVRGAVHLDNARLHRQESRAAATLQRSMMPSRPPKIPGVRIAHRYMPGNRRAQVGGDWFDAIQLPGGRVALIVGDVMGHGLLSAAVMGQFRTAVITMAALDLPPAQLLRHLDNLAHRLSPEHLATCVYVVYDPIRRTLTLANAGHIPPVLWRHDGRAELLPIPGGAPIGVGGVPFETVEVAVPDGDWLVLCTDGLVEVRGQGIDAGLAALCAGVIEPHQTPEEVCDQILSRVHSDDRRDDVALLVANFQGIPPEDVAAWKLSLTPSEVSRARDLVHEQLTRWSLESMIETTQLLVSELVTNALRSAWQEVELRLMRVGKLLVEVSDDDHNLPQLRRAEAHDEGGRGLALVSNLSRQWGTSRKAVGKVVWFELPLPG
jgi:PAS domain S-box-containing protein